jgi:hypothetical protein
MNCGADSKKVSKSPRERASLLILEIKAWFVDNWVSMHANAKRCWMFLNE